MLYDAYRGSRVEVCHLLDLIPVFAPMLYYSNGKCCAEVCLTDYETLFLSFWDREAVRVVSWKVQGLSLMSLSSGAYLSFAVCFSNSRGGETSSSREGMTFPRERHDC